jgi:hypothetical protein
VATVLAGMFEPSALVGGDTFFAFLERGVISPWLPEAHRQNDVVIQAAAAAAGRMAAGGYTVVYDGVIGPWFLPSFITATRLPRLHYLVLLPSEQRCVHRVATRQGHGFTDLHAARHMYRQFADAQIESRHVITEPPAEPDTTAKLIRARLVDGVFAYPTTG